MRVVVAEDVMLTREGIVRLLADAGVEVVGESGNVDGLMRAVATQKPDVALVDIRMPPTHTDEGIVAAQKIRELHPHVGVLVLSQYIDPGYAMRLLEDSRAVRVPPRRADQRPRDPRRRADAARRG